VEARTVEPDGRSLTKTSGVPFVSPATRLAALLTKATRVPSAEIDAPKLSAPPSTPLPSVEARVIAPLATVFTKTSVAAFVSPPTRLVASLVKAT
jgi:hypothetical protein